MKKRTIIAILITITVIILTNQYWLVFKPMPVDIEISGVGKCNIIVELNKKDNDEFEKIKTDSKFVDLDKISQVSLRVKKSRHPKRIRIILSDTKINSRIVINSISLKNNKYRISNLEKISISGAKVVSKNNSELVFIPDSNVVMLTYPDRLNIFTPIYFDIKMFIIILVITYLCSYKLSNYVAEFKTVQGKSRIDIIFLTIFFIFLFIPMSHINRDNISESENRTLAKWQPLINQNGEINYNFGKDFNEWFNDRFYLRKKFIDTNAIISALIVNKFDRGVYDKENQMTYPNIFFGHNEIEAVKENFKALYEFDRYCSRNNIKLYTLIVPNKPDIYLTKYSYTKDGYKHDDFVNYIDYINSENKIKVVYPYKEFMKTKKNGKLLYFKTEHHWTDYGAFVGYQELMKVINKDYPSLKSVNEKDYDYFYSKKVRGDFDRKFYYGQDMGRIGIPEFMYKKYHTYDYCYYKHKNFEELKEEIIDCKYHRQKTYFYDKGADYRVVLLGTSMNENLTEFIPFTFKNVKRIRNNTIQGIKANEEFKIIKFHEKEILNYKPNIIIFCITYQDILRLHDLFKE